MVAGNLASRVRWGNQRYRPWWSGHVGHDAVVNGLKAWFEANDWWLSSSGWVIGVLGVVLAVVAWVRPYRSKMLAWDVVSNTPIAAVPAGAGHELEITYSGRPVKAAHLLVVRLKNIGREAVEVDDYAQPVRFEFSDASELLTYAVVRQSTALDPTFHVDTHHPRRVEVNPLLLNPGDWLDLQFVTDGRGEVPAAATRIANQTRPMGRGSLRRPLSPLTWVGVIGWGVFVYGVVDDA